MAELTRSFFRGILRGSSSKDTTATIAEVTEENDASAVFETPGKERPTTEQTENDGEEATGDDHDDAGSNSTEQAAEGAASADAPKVESELETSDEDEDLIVKEGVLSKWTNYVHGWQDRYLVLRDGILSYFKDKGDTSSLCRGLCVALDLQSGSIDMTLADITKHEFDSLRFDITVSDQAYYLRATTAADRQEWMDTLAQVKVHFHNLLCLTDLGSKSERACTPSFDTIIGVNKLDKFWIFYEVTCVFRETCGSENFSRPSFNSGVRSH